MKLWGWQYEQTLGLSDGLFILMQSPLDLDNAVRARIVSMSQSLSNNYSNVFEGSGADQKHSSIAGVLQGGIWANEFESLKKFENRTLITKAQSLQIWGGFASQSISLTLEFIALQDPRVEVEGAIATLERWASPQLNDSFVDTAKKALENLMSSDTVDDSVFGYTPSPITLNFLSKRYNSQYVITGVEQSQERMVINQNHLRLEQTVSLSLSSRTGLSRDQFLDI